MVEPPVATTAVVVPSAVNLVALQERASFQATIHDQNGQVMPGAPVTWSTSDPAVVTVDATGTAVSVGNGHAQVAAVSGNATAAASVEVAQRGAVVEVDWGGPRLLLGDSVQVTLPVANDPNGHRVGPARIAWTTSDPAVATIDPDGWMRTVGPGQVRIEVDVGGFVDAQDYAVDLDPGFLQVALTLPPAPAPSGPISASTRHSPSPASKALPSIPCAPGTMSCTAPAPPPRPRSSSPGPSPRAVHSSSGCPIAPSAPGTG